MRMFLGGRDEYGPSLVGHTLRIAELGCPASCQTVLMSGIPAVALVTESTKLGLKLLSSLS